MLRIWKATERQRLVPVEMETAFPFLLEPDHVVSLLGGGGKTTLLYEMAGFGVRNGQNVLVTTSTHLYRPPEEWRDRTLKEVERKFQAGCAAIIGSDCRDPKKIAMPEEQLFETARKKADLTLIEADGTKHLPCKVPAEHEPALLSCSDLVVGVTGLSALGQPLEKSCFRAKLAAERLGCPMDHRITEEDLAQLIYDCKNANTDARISVKLVSEAGVGTIAAGVAKAGAQVILISGYDGGTGAAPANSIHHAGLPWELGLAETHQTLIMNDLRNKVILETDGKLMTGRDIAIAAILGAEEFGFATAPLVTMGCVMMRVCNLDTCPVGVATQNPELRKRFKGKPEYVMNFMRFAAQELREYMAKLGVRTVDELVGRTDLIKAGKMAEEYNVDLSRIIDNPFANDAQSKISYANKNPYNFELEKTVDETVLMKKLGPALEKKQKKTIEIDVSNINRSLGTIFGSEITKKYGTTLDEDTFVVKCHGSGGQSFGAFIPKGLTLELVGDSNDYIGKGLSGGKIIVYPQDGIRYDASENIIVGNVALYGATSGKAFINGVAGERFAVRNSGATAVVEGVGEHGCEYMTGGRVVILGPTGKNFAAGMSGGIAYVLDMDSDLYMKLNKQMVEVESVVDKYDVMELKDMIVEHVQCTNSKRGKEVLEHFEEYLPKFKKIIPHDYKKMMSTIGQMEVKGLSSEQALIEAFYAIKNH